MNCLQCGTEMKMEIFDKDSKTANYECKKCDIGFHVLMYHLYHIENNLVLSTHGGLRVARSI